MDDYHFYYAASKCHKMQYIFQLLCIHVGFAMQCILPHTQEKTTPYRYQLNTMVRKLAHNVTQRRGHAKRLGLCPHANKTVHLNRASDTPSAKQNNADVLKFIVGRSKYTDYLDKISKHRANSDNEVISHESADSRGDELLPVLQPPSDSGRQPAVVRPVDCADTSTTKIRRFFGPLTNPNWLVDMGVLASRPAAHWSQTFESALLWAVGLLGTVQNSAVVLTCLFSRHFRQPLHMLVGVLSVTDLIISACYIPTYASVVLDTMFYGPPGGAGGPQLRSDDLCSVAHQLFVMSASMALTTKDLIAVYLQLFAYSRTWTRVIFSRRNTVAYVIIAFAFNFLMLYLPRFFGYATLDFYSSAFVCSRHANVSAHAQDAFSDASYNSTVAILHYLFSLIVHLLELGITCICFVDVRLAITRGRRASERHVPQTGRVRANYRRAARITTLVFASCVVCWLPIYAVTVVDPDRSRLPLVVHRVSVNLFLLKSVINPLIYIYGMRALRHEMKLVCMCSCRGERRRRMSEQRMGGTWERRSEQRADTWDLVRLYGSDGVRPSAHSTRKAS